MVGENIWGVFLAVPRVVGEIFLGVFLAFGPTSANSPILRRTNKRPEILADLITGSPNPGTFNWILRKTFPPQFLVLVLDF